LTSGFLHGSVSPKALVIPLGPFQIFSKIRRDIRSSRCTTGIGVVDTGGKWKKSSIRKIFIPRIFEKIRNGPKGVLKGWGELIHGKN
jgi:hypothetical protein